MSAEATAFFSIIEQANSIDDIESALVIALIRATELLARLSFKRASIKKSIDDCIIALSLEVELDY